MDDPDDFELRQGTLLIEFPCRVLGLRKIKERVFAVLENGQTVDITELLGKAKH